MKNNWITHFKEKPKIIVICEKCQQKLRIPLRNRQLHVTCPKCRYDFDHPDGDEFFLITPTEIKGLVLGLVMIILGYSTASLIDVFPKHSIPDTIVFAFFCMIPAGIICFIIFGLLALIVIDDILRFRNIGRIVVSESGITIYRKDGNTDRVICWQQVKSIELQGLKHLFLGVAETRREPTTLIFSLVDGDRFVVPIDLILKEKDRNRMVSIIGCYVLI